MTNKSIEASLSSLNEQELRRLLVQHLTEKKLGLTWEHSAIERDKALNAHIVLPRLVAEHSHGGQAGHYENMVIEGDNFDSLRLLKSTHAGKVRVIYIDPPYNTGNKDWVYNDHYVGAKDRWRHSQWLEFLYQRLTLARDLLTSDGVILVSINDENRSRLELLMDEVFPGRRLGSLVWRTKDTGNDLTQRFSHVHEHVLVYANTGFTFNGRATDKSKFRNPDNDPKGDWSPQPLTKAHSYIDRENTYYPVQDPDTGYWYPCDPNRVWAYASEKVIRKLCDDDEEAIKESLAALRSDTMETLISKKLIYFPPCKVEEVMRFENKAQLLDAIKTGKGPVLPKKKTPLLRADLPDLDFWIGKPIAPGRPSRKEHWTAKPEEDRLAPLSSWIAGVNEDSGYDDDDLSAPEMLRTTRGGVATDEVKSILGSKAFQFPKPLTLIQGLLAQASRPGDTVLDFFSGSGTTGHAVLALNAQDGGERRFILCSSTEVTGQEPDKNLCRDVCAERIRRVIKSQGYQANFAYIQLDKLDPADARLDASFENARQLLAMRFGQCALSPSTRAVEVLGINDGVAYVIMSQVNTQSIHELMGLPYDTLAVYSHRPSTVAEQLANSRKKGNCYSIADAIALGQAGGKA